jgi:hypothetical protein
MKNFRTTIFFLLIALSVFYIACRGGRRTYPIVPPEEQSRAYLKIINTAESYENPPGSGIRNPALDFKYQTYSSSAVIARNLRFPGGWPAQGYANLVEAGIDVDTTGVGQLFLAANLNPTWVEVMKPQILELEGEKKHTAWIIDSAQTLVMRHTVDEYRFTDTTAAVRFYHANAYEMDKDLIVKFRSKRPTGDTCEIGRDSVFQNNMAFAENTMFHEVYTNPDRSYDIFLMNRDSTTQYLAKAGLRLLPKAAYAIFLYNTASGNKDVQLIRIE